MWVIACQRLGSCKQLSSLAQQKTIGETQKGSARESMERFCEASWGKGVFWLGFVVFFGGRRQ
jgi:hypothetical protein